MIRMIAKDLRINPLRTSLTALSMFIGIIALIAGVLVGTLGRDYLEAVNARLGGKSPTYSAIVDVPSSANMQVVTALQERLAYFRPGIASAQYHLNDLAIWASSGDGNTEIRRVTIIITDAERTRIMPAPIIEGTWLTGADEPATLETAVNESARQYVHDGTVALARTGNPQQVPARVNSVIADGTDTPTIYVNATTLQRYWPQAWEPDGLTISSIPMKAWTINTPKPRWTICCPTSGPAAYRHGTVPTTPMITSRLSVFSNSASPSPRYCCCRYPPSA